MRRVVVVVLGLLLLLAGCSSAVTAEGQGTTIGSSGLPTVTLAELPQQAQETYELVEAGGPFDYRQDGQVFGNRERLLPAAEYGWYREYTTFFYTDDHYESFSEVIL